MISILKRQQVWPPLDFWVLDYSDQLWQTFWTLLEIWCVFESQETKIANCKLPIWQFGKPGDINCHPLSPLTSRATAAISAALSDKGFNPQNHKNCHFCSLLRILSHGAETKMLPDTLSEIVVSWPFLIPFNSASSPTLFFINLLKVSHTSRFKSYYDIICLIGKQRRPQRGVGGSDSGDASCLQHLTRVCIVYNSWQGLAFLGDQRIFVLWPTANHFQGEFLPCHYHYCL